MGCHPSHWRTPSFFKLIKTANQIFINHYQPLLTMEIPMKIPILYGPDVTFDSSSQQWAKKGSGNRSLHRSPQRTRIGCTTVMWFANWMTGMCTLFDDLPIKKTMAIKRVYIYIHTYICIYIYTYTHIYNIYIYIYMEVGQNQLYCQFHWDEHP